MFPTELSTGDSEFQLFVSGGRYCVYVAFLVGYADMMMGIVPTRPWLTLCAKSLDMCENLTSQVL